MKYSRSVLSAVVALGMAATVVIYSNSHSTVDDRQEILNHIHSIFRAYMEADLPTIEATHSKDWTGFNSQSQSIVHGIDAYMANARRALSGSRIVRYELEETEVQIHGDTGIVYYVANWSVRVDGLEQLVRIHARSVDIYQKRAGGWIQIGSNLNILPRPGAVSKEACEPCFDVALEDAQ